MLIQQQRGAVANIQAYPAHIVHRLAGPRNPLDPYDHLVQQRQQLAFPQGKCQWLFACHDIGSTHKLEEH